MTNGEVVDVIYDVFQDNNIEPEKCIEILVYMVMIMCESLGTGVTGNINKTKLEVTIDEEKNNE